MAAWQAKLDDSNETTFYAPTKRAAMQRATRWVQADGTVITKARPWGHLDSGSYRSIEIDNESWAWLQLHEVEPTAPAPAPGDEKLWVKVFGERSLADQ